MDRSNQVETMEIDGTVVNAYGQIVAIKILEKQYTVDPETGLPFVDVSYENSSDCDFDFKWAIPEGYHVYDTFTTENHDNVYISYRTRVRFGTLQQIASLSGCVFVPDQEVA